MGASCASRLRRIGGARPGAARKGPSTSAKGVSNSKRQTSNESKVSSHSSRGSKDGASGDDPGVDIDPDTFDLNFDNDADDNIWARCVSPFGETQLFPMYVVNVPDFLAMTDMQPHQVLRDKGIAHEYDQSQDEIAVFVSHQWSGRRHPDPSMRQLSVLQGAFRNALQGKLRVDADMFCWVAYRTKPTARAADFKGVGKWKMWYDYFSIPQPEAETEFAPTCNGAGEVEALWTDLEEDLGKAVSSLSHYVEACQFFIVLAPPIPHEDGHIVDYKTWRTRGWCRFERLARVLHTKDNSMLLLKRDDTVFQIGAHDFIFDPVGLGTFSEEGDRTRLAPTVIRLLETKLQGLLDKGKMQEYRRFMSLRALLLDGLNADWQVVNPVKEEGEDLATAEHFLRSMHMQSPTQVIDGTTPLLLAACLGDIKLVTDLLELKADVNDKEAFDVPEFIINKGFTALQLSVRQGNAAVVALLLEKGANIKAKDRTGCTVLHSLAGCPADRLKADQLISLLIDQDADIAARIKIGLSALDFSVIFGREEVIQSLLAHGSPTCSSREGLNPLHHCALFGPGPDIVKLLLDAGTSPNERLLPRRGGLLWLLLSGCYISHRLGFRDFFSHFGRHCWGATPLMLAVMFGHVAEARALIRGGSDKSAKNSEGIDMKELDMVFNESTRHVWARVVSPEDAFAQLLKLPSMSRNVTPNDRTMEELLASPSSSTVISPQSSAQVVSTPSGDQLTIQHFAVTAPLEPGKSRIESL